MHHVLGLAARRAALIVAGVIAAACFIGPALAAQPPAATEAREVWRAIDEAFDARDAGSFSELFARDASFVRVKRGEALEGRTAIYGEFARRFPGFPPDVRHHTTIDRVATIAPGILAADGKVEILRGAPEAGADPALLSRYAIFAVMTRQPEGLQVRSLRIYELPKETEGLTAP